MRFSEPPTEAAPESKLRILLGEAVQSVALRQDGGRTGGSVHIGSVSATGEGGEGEGERRMGASREADDLWCEYVADRVLTCSLYGNQFTVPM